jgi:hypothetical protein
MATRTVLQRRWKGIPLPLWLLVVFAISPCSANIGWAGDQNPAKSFIAHVASFQNPANAENFVKILEKKGVHAWSKKVDVPGKGNFHRVYVGAFESRETAFIALQKLKDERVISYFTVESVRSDEILEKGKPQPKAKEVKKATDLTPKSAPKVKEQAIPGKPMPSSTGKASEGAHPAENAKGAAPSPLKEKKEADSRMEILVPDPVEAIPDTPAEPEEEPFDEEKESLYDYKRGIGYLQKEQFNWPLSGFNHSIRIDPNFATGDSEVRDTFHDVEDPEDRTYCPVV